MSGSVSQLPTPYLNCTHYAWTETQQAQNLENQAPACNSIVVAMDNTQYDMNRNRCDIAEAVGVVTAQTYAIQAAGG